jgi:hypothetical protein
MTTEKTTPIPRNLSGQRIALARIARHPAMSQAKLSKRLLKYGLHLNQVIISRIENQDRGVTDIELVAIAHCLRVSVAWLCGEKR